MCEFYKYPSWVKNKFMTSLLAKWDGDDRLIIDHRPWVKECIDKLQKLDEVTIKTPGDLYFLVTIGYALDIILVEKDDAISQQMSDLLVSAVYTSDYEELNERRVEWFDNANVDNPDSLYTIDLTDVPDKNYLHVSLEEVTEYCPTAKYRLHLVYANEEHRYLCVKNDAGELSLPYVEKETTDVIFASRLLKFLGASVGDALTGSNMVQLTLAAAMGENPLLESQFLTNLVKDNLFTLIGECGYKWSTFGSDTNWCMSVTVGYDNTKSSEAKEKSECGLWLAPEDGVLEFSDDASVMKYLGNISWKTVYEIRKNNDKLLCAQMRHFLCASDR